MIAEHLADLIMQLKRPRSTPLAIWFIDRPERFYELLKERDPQGEHMVTYADHELTFHGMPIYNFDPYTATGDKFYVTPFYQKPGIWVEMKDGKHLRLNDDLT